MKISLSHALRVVDCSSFLPVTNAVVYSNSAKAYARKKDGGYYIFTSPLVKDKEDIEILHNGQKYISPFDAQIKTVYINTENAGAYPVLILSCNAAKGLREIPCSILGFGNNIVIDDLYCEIKKHTHKIESYSEGVLTLYEPVKVNLKACDEIKIKAIN